MSTSINFDNNYTETLSVANEDEITEVEDESIKDLATIDKIEEEEEGKLTKFLKKISLGQYTTPLYFREKESYSSVTGGAITLICVSLFVAYGIWVMISVFN